MFETVWTIGTGHAYAPGAEPLFATAGLGPLGVLFQSGGGVVVTTILALLIARVLDHLFSPSPQRRLGPRRS